MKFPLKWLAALTALAAAGVWLPSASGQLRIQSGALSRSSGILHPRELEKQIFYLTNDARRRNGVAALTYDNSLTLKAREKSDDMLKNNYFSHTSPTGKTFKDRLQEEKPASFRTIYRAGENIYMGSRFDYNVDIKTQARLIVDGWMTSPGHRKNMLEPGFTHMGVGVSTRDKECYATQIFTGMAPRPQ